LSKGFPFLGHSLAPADRQVDGQDEGGGGGDTMQESATAKQEERDQSPAVCFASAALHTARLADCCYFKQLLWIVPAAAAFRGAG